MRRGILALAVCASTSAIANPQPVVGTDDVRTHGPIARHLVESSVAFQRSSGPEEDDAVGLYTFQLGLGPRRFTGKAGEVLGWTKRYAARVRLTVVDPEHGNAAVGPMTFALQRYLFIAPLELAPLLHLHAGLGAAVATPWLEGRTVTAPSVLQVTDAVNTELAGNGWSLRPAEAFVRLDFLACRAIHVELGASPEAFVSADDTQATEYGLRGHVQLGASFACGNAADSWLHHLAAVVEYRARGRLYASGAPFAYHDLAGVGLQYDVGAFLFAASVSVDPGSNLDDYLVLGARVQLGFGRTR